MPLVSFTCTPNALALGCAHEVTSSEAEFSRQVRDGNEAPRRDRCIALFGEGLGLDSIDALQLVVAMEKEFGTVVPDAATGSTVFVSVRSMADFIANNCK